MNVPSLPGAADHSRDLEKIQSSCPGRGWEKAAQNHPKICPQGASGADPYFASFRERWKGRSCGKSQAGSLWDPQAPEPVPGWIGVIPCGSSCPGWGQPLTPTFPCLTLGFPTSSQENPEQHPPAALPRPSKALVNPLLSLNYTKAMTALSSLYNASV